MVELETDSELMMQVRQGQTAKLGILFERHHERLLSFFMRMTGSRSASEDLVQEVFVRMLRYRDSFRGGSDSGFTAWMYTLARNACTDQLRKQARRKESPAPEVEPPSDESPAPERLDRSRSIQALRRALLKLAPDKREVLVLSRYDFKKFDEIAEILGCPVGTAKVRAHRAIRELRKIYESMLSEAHS